MPCGAINDLAEVFADPQVRERGMVHRWQHPLTDAAAAGGQPDQAVGHAGAHRRPPPLLGQHTDEVLRGVLGWSEARIASCSSKEVI